MFLYTKNKPIQGGAILSRKIINNKKKNNPQKCEMHGASRMKKTC